MSTMAKGTSNESIDILTPVQINILGILMIAVVAFFTIYPRVATQTLGEETLFESGEIDIPSAYSLELDEKIKYCIWHNETTDELILEVHTKHYDELAHNSKSKLPGQGYEKYLFDGNVRYGYLGKLSDYDDGQSIGSQVIATEEVTQKYFKVHFTTDEGTYSHVPKAGIISKEYYKFFKSAPIVYNIECPYSRPI